MTIDRVARRAPGGSGALPLTGTRIAAHSMVREVNRSLVLDILREGQPVSRVELARRARLSKPTVSSIVTDLLAAGLVRQVGVEASLHAPGRPPALLAYDERSSGVAAIQLGTDTTRVAVADGLGKIIAAVTLAAAPGDVDRSLGDAGRALGEAVARSGMRREQIESAGVAVPGRVDPDSGTVVAAEAMGWRDVPLRRRLAGALRLPVVVAPSIQAAALAELRLAGEAARGGMVWVYAGSTIGCAIVLEGRVLMGTRGLGGEIGHVPVVDAGPACRCGRHGCLETFACTVAITRNASDAIRRGEPTSLPSGRTLTAEVVMRHAGAGDAVAAAAVREAGAHLGRGVGGLINLLNPELVVIGGPLADSSPPYVAAAAESARLHARSADSVAIRATELGATGALLGVIQLALGAAPSRAPRS